MTRFDYSKAILLTNLDWASVSSHFSYILIACQHLIKRKGDSQYLQSDQDVGIDVIAVPEENRNRE